MFSQTSISTALAMLYAGAGTTTAAQMAARSTSACPPAPARRVQRAGSRADHAAGRRAAPRRSASRSRTRLWVQDGFTVLPGYLDTLAENTAPDFSSRTSVGDRKARASESTAGSPIAPRIRFRRCSRRARSTRSPGWCWPTRSSSTATGRAVQERQPERDLPRAHRRRQRADHARRPQRRALERTGWNAAAIDYVGDTASMIIVVPDAGTFRRLRGRR